MPALDKNVDSCEWNVLKMLKLYQGRPSVWEALTMSRTLSLSKTEKLLRGKILPFDYLKMLNGPGMNYQDFDLQTNSRYFKGNFEKCGETSSSDSLAPHQYTFRSLKNSANEFDRSNIAPSIHFSNKIILYKGKWMRPFRLAVRFKIFQLLGVASLAIPIAQFTNEGSLSLSNGIAIGFVIGGSLAASYALWFYSNRYIGELSLMNGEEKKVEISVLDFWGNRKNIKVALKDVIPPLEGMTNEELTAVSSHVLIPLEVMGLRQFCLSLRHGKILEKDILLALLKGKLATKDDS